jgi:hypothetical protein
LFPPELAGDSSPPEEQASSMVTPKNANATVGHTFFKNSLLLFFMKYKFVNQYSTIIPKINFI